MMDDLTNQGVTASQSSSNKHDGRPHRPSLDRLLRSAAQSEESGAPSDPPFGFDTRVVALWRSMPVNGNNGLAHLLRRVAILATAVIVISSSAAIYEINRSRDSLNEPLTNEFAMADSAIQDEVLP